MSKKMRKNQPDERIQKETNHLAGKMFYVISALLVISLVVKCCFRLPVYVYALEIVALVAGFACYLIRDAKFGILGVKNKDEALREIHNETMTKAMMVQFWVMIIGEVIPMIVCAYNETVAQYFWWFTSYLLMFFPVALVFTIVALKKGWLVWGNKKQEKAGKKRFAATLPFSALLYGVLFEAMSGFKHVYHDGAFDAKGILLILGMSVAWGVLFGLFMLGAMKFSGKQAEKHVPEADSETVEQEVR